MRSRVKTGSYCDLVDLKRITVRVNEKLVTLEQAEDNTWTATLPLEVNAGEYELTLVAVDFAANSSETTAILKVGVALPVAVK